MRTTTAFVLVRILSFYLSCLSLVANAKFLPDSVVCPRYFSTPGDTLESIASLANADPDAVALSIESCGGRLSPLSLGMVCLPGGEYEACKHVKNFRDNPRCAYYVVQAGDTAAMVAKNLNLYLPSIEMLNNGTMKLDQVNPGEVLKLPPWDVSCGASLPKTDLEVQALPPAPPPPAQKLIGAGGTGVGQGAAPSSNLCVAYRAQPWDSIFTVASSFSVPIGRLFELNPDYANGKVVTGGSIVVLENPGGVTPCLKYTFKEGFGEISATANLSPPSPPSPPPPPPGPIRLGLVTEANPQIINEGADMSSTDANALDYELRDEETSGTYNGRPIINNIVTDKTQATQPPTGSGPDVGIYIMIGCLSLVILVVLSVISVAISNSVKRLGNAAQQRKPLEQNGRKSSGKGDSGSDASGNTAGSSKMSETSDKDPEENV